MVLKLHYESSISLSIVITDMQDSQCSFNTMLLLTCRKTWSGGEKKNCFGFQTRVGIIRREKDFYHSFLSENEVRII